jgi:hypothetical protein
MRNAFRYMPVDRKNMVVENNKVLCVECGFEVVAISTLTPEATFDGHKCRLVSQSESTSF